MGAIERRPFWVSQARRLFRAAPVLAWLGARLIFPSPSWSQEPVKAGLDNVAPAPPAGASPVNPNPIPTNTYLYFTKNKPTSVLAQSASSTPKPAEKARVEPGTVSRSHLFFVPSKPSGPPIGPGRAPTEPLANEQSTGPRDQSLNLAPRVSTAPRPAVALRSVVATPPRGMEPVTGRPQTLPASNRDTADNQFTPASVSTARTARPVPGLMFFVPENRLTARQTRKSLPMENPRGEGPKSEIRGSDPTSAVPVQASHQSARGPHPNLFFTPRPKMGAQTSSNKPAPNLKHEAQSTPSSIGGTKPLSPLPNRPVEERSEAKIAMTQPRRRGRFGPTRLIPIPARPTTAPDPRSPRQFSGSRTSGRSGPLTVPLGRKGDSSQPQPPPYAAAPRAPAGGTGLPADRRSIDPEPFRAAPEPIPGG